MKNLTFNFENSLVDINSLSETKYKLETKINEIKEDLEKNNESKYAFFNPKKFTNNLDQILELSEKIKQLQPDLLLIIGIGGSNLSTKALVEALFGKFHNNFNQNLKILFIDTIDQDYTSSLLQLVENDLISNKKVIINIVSKSGSTTEIIANSSLFIDLLKKYNSDISKQLVITTDQDSPLHKKAKQENWYTLEIPKNIGGRFSVFTAVALFPLSLLNIDIKKFIDYAANSLHNCFNNNIDANLPAISALILSQHYTLNRNIHDTFLFSPNLENIGNWYRQLCAESLGKNNKGFTPTVSIATTDLHSVAQLYLDGPDDRITTFINYLDESEKLVIKKSFLENNEINNKSITFIKKCIFIGTQNAYKTNKRPFITISLKDKSESCLAELMMFKMAETIFLGHLLEIDPFGQPAVEEYKKEARNCLIK